MKHPDAIDHRLVGRLSHQGSWRVARVMIALGAGRNIVLAGLLAVALLGSSGETRAQGAKSEEEQGWSNSTRRG